MFLKIQTNRASCQGSVKGINYCERNLATFATFSSHNNLFSVLSFNFIFSVTTTLLYIFNLSFFTVWIFPGVVVKNCKFLLNEVYYLERFVLP